MKKRRKGNAAEELAAVTEDAPRKIRTTRAPERANRTKLLVSIVNAGEEHRLKQILDECSISIGFVFAGKGTARSAILDYLGIGETKKAVIFSLFPESDEDAILREIGSGMSLYLVGRGISFTIPLTAVSEIVANGLSGAASVKMTEEKRVMNQERKYELIVAAVNADLVDDAMEAARSAGAAGGTIIRARTIDNDKAAQFVGISLASDQEILFILSKREGRRAIMEALSERVGLKTEAGGVIFSLPVDKTVGIGTAGETDEAVPAQKERA